MSQLPQYLNRHVGLAMHMFLRTEPPATTAEVRAALERSGEPGASRSIRSARTVGTGADQITPLQITQVIRAARSNVAATRRAQQATENQSVRAACDYKCPEDSIVGIRVRFNYTVPETGRRGVASVIVNVPARSNLLDAVRLARELFNNSEYNTAKYGHYRAIADGDPSAQEIDSVSLGGFEGGTLVY